MKRLIFVYESTSFSFKTTYNIQRKEGSCHRGGVGVVGSSTGGGLSWGNRPAGGGGIVRTQI